MPTTRKTGASGVVRTWGRDSLGNATGYTVNMYSVSGQKLGAYMFQPTTWEHGGFYTPVIQVTLSSIDAYFGSRRLAVLDQLGSAALTSGGQPQTFYPWGEPRGNIRRTPGALRPTGGIHQPAWITRTIATIRVSMADS